MLTIELVPSLSNCIHTITKREYADTLGQLLSGKPGNRKLKRKLELLTSLLKEIDFKQLRHESEIHLMAGEKVRFFFYLEKGTPRYKMQIENSR